MLCRYITRPAVAEERLELTPAGDLILRLKTPYADGTSHLLFSGVEFVEKLAALIPPARIHLTRFFGCLAPHARIRCQIVPQPAAVNVSAAPHPELPTATSERTARAQRWAELLARVFGMDLQRCTDCGNPLKIVSAILDPVAVRRILTYLGLPDKPPELAPRSYSETSAISLSDRRHRRDHARAHFNKADPLGSFRRNFPEFSPSAAGGWANSWLVTKRPKAHSPVDPGTTYALFLLSTGRSMSKLPVRPRSFADYFWSV